MTNELTIIIAGDNNAGKSTMMLQIEKLLQDNGFNVELSFDGNPDFTGEHSFFFHKKEELNFEERINTIKNKSKIRIMESHKDCNYVINNTIKSQL